MGKLVSAVIQDNRNRKAVREAATATGIAARETRAGKKQALGFYEPYRLLGQEAVSPLSGLALGRQYDPETGEFRDISAEERADLFEASPDYQFRLQEGQRALEASQAARGGLLSGRALIESQALGQNIAASEYQNYMNRLQALAGMGMGAAGASAGISTGTAQQLANQQLALGQVRAQRYQQQGQMYGEAAQEIVGAGMAAAGGGVGGAGAGGGFGSSFMSALGGGY